MQKKKHRQKNDLFGNFSISDTEIGHRLTWNRSDRKSTYIQHSYDFKKIDKSQNDDSAQNSQWNEQVFE